MRELLILGIFIALSLVLQIFFLRLSKDFMGLKEEEPRFKKMLCLIYVNLGVYITMILLLFYNMLKT